MFLYGGIKHKGGGSGSNNRFSYQTCFNKPNNQRPVVNQPRVRYSFEDVVLDSRSDAEEILYRMDEILATYGMVRVADLYEFAGISSNFTDNDYGWYDIRTAEIVRVRDGYIIKMPRAVPLK